MNLSELALSANFLIQAFVAVLYGAAGLAAFRWLLPRLSPPKKRLAIVFFVAQLLMLGIALIIEPSGKLSARFGILTENGISRPHSLPSNWLW